MSTTYFILIVLGWFTTGAGSFIFWWTKDHDLRPANLLLAFACGFMGPIAFIAGWSIHGKGTGILIKKRTGEGKILQKMKSWTKGSEDDSEL